MGRRPPGASLGRTGTATVAGPGRIVPPHPRQRPGSATFFAETVPRNRRSARETPAALRPVHKRHRHTSENSRVSPPRRIRLFHIVSRLANRRSEAPAPLAGLINRQSSPEPTSGEAPGSTAVARSAGRFRGHTFQPETRCQSVRTTLAAGVYVWRPTPLCPERRRLSLDANRTGGEVNQTRTARPSREMITDGARVRNRLPECRSVRRGARCNRSQPSGAGEFGHARYGCR